MESLSLPQIPDISAEESVDLFRTVAPNVVQSIRAFRPQELREEAIRIGHHFLYAWCANGYTKQQVLSTIAHSFFFPRPAGRNFDAMAGTLDGMVANKIRQPGFVIVLDQLPNTQRFDKEARESLLDVFRDSAEHWAEKKIPFRVFYSFA